MPSAVACSGSSSPVRMRCGEPSGSEDVVHQPHGAVGRDAQVHRQPGAAGEGVGPVHRRRAQVVAVAGVAEVVQAGAEQCSGPFPAPGRRTRRRAASGRCRAPLGRGRSSAVASSCSPSGPVGTARGGAGWRRPARSTGWTPARGRQYVRPCDPRRAGRSTMPNSCRCRRYAPGFLRVRPRTYDKGASTVKNSLLGELSAEFLGTMILILFGNGVVAQVVTNADKRTRRPRRDRVGLGHRRDDRACMSRPGSRAPTSTRP